MHCPECGQQQINEEIRFCSRCGLPLSVISQVVANRGTLPRSEEPPKKRTFLSKKAGIFIGIVWMLFFLLLVTPFLDILGAPGELTSMAAIFGVFSGTLIILGSAFFLSGHREEHESHYLSQPPLQRSAPNALPPQQSIPVQDYTAPAHGRWKTNDLAPHSVTDGTTKLLQEEE